MSKQNNIVKVHCNECSKAQDHVKLCFYESSGEDECIWWRNEYEILRCGGCRNITFRKRLLFSEDQDPDPSSPPRYHDTYYPPITFREKPEWFYDLDASLYEILEEVYIALQNGTHFLATIGARTALDIILNEKVKDIGGFAQKLKELRSQGFISEPEYQMLSAVVEAGNAAAHRGYSPKKSDLVLVMDILESIIFKLYIQEGIEVELTKRAQELKTKVPKRNKK